MYRQEEDEQGAGEDLCHPSACKRRLRATQSPNEDDNLDEQNENNQKPEANVQSEGLQNGNVNNDDESQGQENDEGQENIGGQDNVEGQG